MTLLPPTPTPASAARIARLHQRRRLALVLLVAVAIGAVLAAGYVATTGTDDSDAAVTSTTQAALVPEGDYGPLCDEIRLGGASPDSSDSSDSAASIDAVYRSLLSADLAAWVAEAPVPFRATLRRLQADRGAAAAVIGDAPDVARLDQATKDRLPPGFTTDLAAVSVLLSTECAPG